MIEKLITSKTRTKLLRFFLTHIDGRYYLRELERILDESLSPLRRQLVKLTKMGILVTEQEANLKYYRLNREFAGIEELRSLLLGGGEAYKGPTDESAPKKDALRNSDLNIAPQMPKRPRYDVVVLTMVSFFILLTALFVAYSSSRNIRQVAGLISDEPKETVAIRKDIKSTVPDQMISRHWKVLSGNVPVLSNGKSGDRGEKTKEL